MSVRINQQIADDYTKVMGTYSNAVDAYNAEAEKFNALPYYANSAINANGNVASGQYRLSGSISDGDRLKQVGTETQTKIGANGEPELAMYQDAYGELRAKYDDSGNPVYQKIDVPIYEKAPVPVAPTEPSMKAPSFTKRQVMDMQNPPQTYTDAIKSAPSRLTQNNDWRPLGDPNDGILQRALKGTV